MKRYCLALDLVDDPQLIKEYEDHHRAVWPGIIDSIYRSGITAMEIYRTGNRLFMIIETNDSFSFENKEEADKQNPVVQEWEDLMSEYQQSLPGSPPGEKWKVMDKIFETRI